jgi:DNA-binding winged helix-turn-helix (wHTH) protein
MGLTEPRQAEPRGRPEEGGKAGGQADGKAGLHDRAPTAQSGSNDGHADDGKADPGQADHGQADDGQADDGQADDGQAGVVPASTLPSAPGSAPREDVLNTANLEIRPGEYQLLADGKRVGLTVREFQTFLVLAERPDRVVTRPEIYALVWGGQMTYRDRSVDVFVRKVRRKLETAAPSWVYIHTHFGVGYRFSPERVTTR